MVVKIFWKNECPNCPPAKELGKKLELSNIETKYFCLDDPDGLSEGVMNDVMATPTVILTDSSDNEIKSWRGNTPSEEEVKSSLNQ